MSEPPTLLSTLVSQAWFYDGNISCVKFRDDGTGELWYGGEMFLTVFHEFNWKALDPKALEQTIYDSRRSGKGVECLSYLSVEIELTDRLALRDERFGKMLKEIKPEHQNPFTEDAFRPKTYTIRLERGAFVLPFIAGSGGKGGQNEPKYSLRLVFDQSPYPASGDWKRPERAGGCYKWKDFVSLDSSVSSTFSNCSVM